MDSRKPIRLRAKEFSAEEIQSACDTAESMVSQAVLEDLMTTYGIAQDIAQNAADKCGLFVADVYKEALGGATATEDAAETESGEATATKEFASMVDALTAFLPIKQSEIDWATTAASVADATEDFTELVAVIASDSPIELQEAQEMLTDLQNTGTTESYKAWKSEHTVDKKGAAISAATKAKIQSAHDMIHECESLNKKCKSVMKELLTAKTEDEATSFEDSTVEQAIEEIIKKNLI